MIAVTATQAPAPDLAGRATGQVGALAWQNSAFCADTTSDPKEV
ncbi:MAG: hypothetical protein NXH74_12145 [Rhodobacteraceae bacterium]|nr:hypothetical protein [Paracoccaceae bacterium]